ncbi:MAG TPA: BrxA/BrxB family bacilliredoxin [Acidobacteriota bacterium]|nr:BrxA/BrxB family bacilliredoxin [Acidobacteriota bacterium]
MYDENMIRPMREEMTGAGFSEARTADEVDKIMSEKGTTLFFINSVCGCAAGVARPGVVASLKSDVLPDRLVTSFAGNDVDAVNRARQHFAGYPPSSPSAAVIRDGQVVHMVERHHIEGQSAENVAKVLQSAYQKFCGEAVDEAAEIYDPLAALEISQEEAKQRLADNGEVAVLDVREPWEMENGKIDGAIAVDRAKAQEIIQDWPRDREIIVYCQHGQRSVQAAQFFQNYGFENIKSLQGGYAAWSESQ